MPQHISCSKVRCEGCGECSLEMLGFERLCHLVSEAISLGMQLGNQGQWRWYECRGSFLHFLLKANKSW